MSYGSDYNERRRRRRRQETRLLVYTLRSVVTTAALVAIAFAFDVPEKIRARLWGPPPQAVVQRPAAEPASPPAHVHLDRSPTVEQSRPEFPGDPPRRKDPAQREIPPEAFPQRDEVHLPPREKPSAIGLNQRRVVPKAEDDEPVGQFLVLRLDKKLMKIPIAELPAAQQALPRVRVVALRGVEDEVQLEPADGVIGQELQLLFPGHPRARILVRADKSGDRLLLVIEPQMALWAEQPMPFTLNRIKSEAYKTRRAGKEFFAALAADKQSKAALENWLNNARGIPLDEYKRGKARYEALESSIQQREDQTETVRQGVQEMDALEQLAGKLHEQAKLWFEVDDVD